jgi:hypothetical protein
MPRGARAFRHLTPPLLDRPPATAGSFSAEITMITPESVTPLEGDALLAMLHATTGMLVRRCRTFVAADARHTTSGKREVQEFTKRLVLALDRAGLVHLDDPQFPERVSLNAHGRKIAELLDAKRSAKAAA